MGIFDFVKEAGKKVGETFDLAGELVKQGLQVDDLSVSRSGDTITVAGRVDSQEDREKVVLALGNLEGVGRVEDRLAVTRPQPQADFYTVKSGDTLSGIAKSFYGDPMKYPVIFDANRPMLEHPDRIYPGQVLRIPAMPPVSES